MLIYILYYSHLKLSAASKMQWDTLQISALNINKCIYKYLSPMSDTLPGVECQVGRQCSGQFNEQTAFTGVLRLFVSPTAQWSNAFTKRVQLEKYFFVKKYLITSLVFKLQKCFLHQNGVEI